MKNFLLLFICFLGTCSIFAQTPVTIKVTLDGAPLPNFSIYVSELNTNLFTDGNGEITVNLNEGHYYCQRYTTSQYLNWTKYFQVSEEAVSIHIEYHSVYFNVKDAIGNAIPNVNVNVDDPNYNLCSSTSDKDGIDTLYLLNNKYNCTTYNNNTFSKTTTFEINNNPKNIDIQYKSITTLEVQEEGSPIVAAHVEIRNMDNNLSISGNTDNSGFITFNLDDEQYLYKVNKYTDGYFLKESIFTTETEQTITVSYENRLPVTFYLKIHENINGLSNSIYIYNQDQNQIILLNTDVTGKAECKLPNGNYSYSFYNNATGNHKGSFTVNDNPATIDFVFYNVKVGLKNNEDLKLAGRWIYFYSSTSNNVSFSLKSDINGEVSAYLLEGTYHYMVSSYSEYAIDKAYFEVSNRSISIQSLYYPVNFTITEQGTPQSNMTVIYNGVTVYTDAAGKKTLYATNGTHDFLVKGNGFEEKTGQITLNNSPESLDINYITSRNQVQFKVTDNNGNLANKTLNVLNNKLELLSNITNVNGECTFSLANGKYSYYMSGTGNYLQDEQQVFEVSDNNPLIQIQYYPVKLTVTEGSTKKENINLTLKNESHTYDGSTDVNGEVVVYVTKGSYSYTVNGETVEFSIESEGKDIAIDLESMPQITFLVVDHTNQPLQGINISIENFNLTTDTEGKCSIRIGLGSHAFSIKSDNYYSKGSVKVTESSQNIILKFYPVKITTTITGYSNHIIVKDEEIMMSINLNDADHDTTVYLTEGDYGIVSMNPWRDTYFTVKAPTTVNISDKIHKLQFKITDGDKYVLNASIQVVHDKITIFNYYMSSNLLGEATSEITPGTYTYTISRSGYPNKIGTFSTLTDNININVTYNTVYPVHFDITESGQVVNNTTQYIYQNQTLIVQTSEMDVQLEQGLYTYKIGRNQYVDMVGEFTVNETTPPIIVNYETFPVDITVLSKNGININNSQTITFYKDQKVVGVINPWSGSLISINLPNGTYTCISTDNSISVSVAHTFTVSDAAVSVLIQHPEVMYVASFICSKDNNPIQNIVVSVLNSQGLEVLNFKSDNNGLYVAKLENGTYTFKASSVLHPLITGAFTVNDQAINVAINYYSVKGISLNKKTTSLSTSATETLTVNFNPTNATNKNVAWKSSNTAIATVNASGLITGIAKGTAYIIATTNEGNFIDTCKVTVKQNVTGVSLDKTNITLEKEKIEQLTATVLPSNADNASVTWKSSNTAIATVSDNGLVTAIEKGTTYIIVTTNDASFTDTCTITVTGKLNIEGTEDVTYAINIYPNPVNDILYISTTNTIENISIYDVNGKIMKRISVTGNRLSVSDLTEGLYVIEIQTKQGKYTQQFIKK